MKYLNIIVVFLIINLHPQLNSQSKYISGGIELGMIKNWTKVKKDDIGIFINNQALPFNIHENYKRVFLKYTNNFSYKLDYTRTIYTDFLCTDGNFIPSVTGQECFGSGWNVNQINISIGKEYKILKWLYLNPSVGIGYVHFGNFEVGYFGEKESGGSVFVWQHSSMSTSFRRDNYNINAGGELIFKLNPILKLKLMYAFQQAIYKIYREDVIAWIPENPEIYLQPTDPSKLKYATVEARGTNTQFGIGLEFLLKTLDKNK